MQTRPTTPTAFRRGRLGFTLIEVLVSVGAAALVALGIAAIFESVGKTVAGGRRVGQFNAYAALLEQQLRQDITRMSREGFLLIRNQYAGIAPTSSPPSEPPKVRLNSEDGTGRIRRVDEILFFANGEFTSAREPMHPSYIARANAARIYYGHGARMLSSDPAYLRPEPYNKPTAGDTRWVLGVPGPGGTISPNQFAADWMLLRHVTLLAGPASTTSYPALPPPATVFTLPTSHQRLADKGGQVALQPAAPHLFRQLAAQVFPLPVIDDDSVAIIPQYLRPFQLYRQNPAFSSGLVDIANTSLSEIRTLVMRLPARPGLATGYTAPSSFADASKQPRSDVRYGTGGLLSALFSRTPPGDVLLQQDWMNQAWPTQSNPIGAQADIGGTAFVDPVPGARMRYEETPPDYLGVLGQSFSKQEEEQYRRIDQSMLTASNLIPRCTEFIVEYSFGQVDSVPSSPTYGQVIWYGLERRADANRDGDTTDAVDPYVVRRFPYKATIPGLTTAPLNVAYLRADGKVGDGGSSTPLYQIDVSRQELINGVGSAPTDPVTKPLTSYFGYVDPTSLGGPNGALAIPPPPPGTPNDDPASPIAWPWPTMIRFTVTIADAKDPTIEETFQFVIDTPDKPAQ